MVNTNIDNVTYESKTQIGSYTAIHTITVPSRVTDYDFDPDNPNKRFFTTLIHQLVFIDNISGVEILSINFSSDECAQILSDLYEYTYKIVESLTPFDRYELSTELVYMKGKLRPALMTIYGSSYEVIINVQLEFAKSSVSINSLQVQSLIDLLDTESLFARYVDELS